MTVFIYLVLLLVLIVISIKKFDRVLNFVSIFSAIWLCFGAISALDIMGLRLPDIKIHIYVWLFVIIVDAVILIFATTKTVYCNSSLKDIEISNKRAKCIQVFTLLMLIPLLYKVLFLIISSGSLVAIREMYFSGEIFPNFFQDLIFRIIPMAIVNALIVYYTFISFEMKKYNYLIIAIADALLATLINGGRYALILLLYVMVLLWTTGNITFTELGIFSKYKKRIRGVFFIIVALITITTIIRGQKIVQSIFVYFAGSLSYLDYIVDNPTMFALDKPLHGYLTFGAFFEPIILLLKAIGITSAKVPSYEFNIYCQKYYDIGSESSHVLFNANTSIIYYFLRDFGFFGIIIGAVVLGAIVVMAYNKWQRGSRFWGLMFVYLGNVLFNSLMTYQLIGTTPLFICVTFYILVQRKFIIKIRSRRQL